MILLIHILMASASLTYTTYLIVRPTRQGLTASYALMALTVLTGILEVVAKPSALAQACQTGLVYGIAVCVGIVVTRRRLLAA